jgi:hypothetical protein
MMKMKKIQVWRVVHSQEGVRSTWETVELARKELALANSDSWEWEDGRWVHHPRCRIVKGWAYEWECDDPIYCGV